MRKTRRKKSWLRPSARSKRELGERGFFGLGALASIGVMIAIALAVGTAIALALPYITEKLATGLNLGPLLIHIPEMQGGTFWTASSSAPESSGIFYMSEVMGDLYGTIMTVSFAVLLIAFVLVGLFYALEQFRVVGEGTASTILSESVFVIILIFVFPLLFNGVAVMINGVNEDIIMHHVDDEGNVTTYDAMVVDVARYAGTVPGIRPSTREKDTKKAREWLERTKSRVDPGGGFGRGYLLALRGMAAALESGGELLLVNRVVGGEYEREHIVGLVRCARERLSQKFRPEDERGFDTALVEVLREFSVGNG